MESPPKRMTRARAAAKANASTAVRTTRIMTAAAKAKAAGASAATTGTAATNKRKTRTDDDEGTLESDQRARRLRARPNRTADGDRGTAAPVASSSSSSLSANPIRATRSTRAASKAAPKQQQQQQHQDTKNIEAAAATRARSRKNTVTRTARAGTVSKPAPANAKKRVKFDETDKENVEPAAKKKSNKDGLRAAPARRPPTPADKTSGSANASAGKKPLSPKKVTQIPILRRDDVDESSPRHNSLAEPVNLTPVKKSTESAGLESTVTANAAVTNLPESTTLVNFGSPPRRPPVSPNRDTFRSPAKKMGSVPFPGSSVKPKSSQDGDTMASTSFKNSLLQTPAKRPPSPIKAMVFTSAQKPLSTQDFSHASLFQSPAKRAHLNLKPVTEIPATAAICETPAMKPIVASTSVCISSGQLPENPAFQQERDETLSEAIVTKTLEGLALTNRFNGRLSDVVPRDNDERNPDEDDDDVNLVHSFSFYNQPTLNGLVPVGDETTITHQSFNSTESTIEMPITDEVASPRKPAATPQGSMFQLRDKDLDPCHDMTAMSESDEETEAHEETCALTPSVTKDRRSTMGLTSLAQTLGNWSSDDHTLADGTVQSTLGLARASTVVPTAEPSPAKTSFFEEQIQAHDEKTEEMDVIADGEISDLTFDDDLMITDEDIALAEEAEEMSELHESPCAERNVVKSFTDSLSDASQEYGDENELPLDPALVNRRMWPPITPARPAPRGCSTTTKVPLKPADDSSPTKTRRFSSSRIPDNRKASMSKSATTISCSAEKRRSSGMLEADREPCPPSSKCDLLPNLGTATRTPRQDANSSLLRGAIVYVDVHTSEGADASLIFVDLLTQMGAKCVKTWSWNPESASNSEASTNKIGITHVVFKDGGKRTMEKVRKSNGIVQCVGVSWVLDCEKENEWLDEASYLIDTSFVPRGGARRRKSMEPKALSNQNGTIVNTPAKQASSYNRRQSGIWVQTTPERAEGAQQDDDIEWSEFILSPVPKTPAPEAISMYAMEGLETPSQGDDGSSMSIYHEEMLMRTCPPRTSRIGNAYEGLGDGVLGRQKDDTVLMRLMAARRKSLQFAPKIASPLSKSWN